MDLDIYSVSKTRSPRAHDLNTELFNIKTINAWLDLHKDSIKWYRSTKNTWSGFLNFELHNVQTLRLIKAVDYIGSSIVHAVQNYIAIIQYRLHLNL